MSHHHHHDHDHDHDHDHHHDHSHEHSHSHDHSHGHNESGVLTFDQKFPKLLTHWIKHNNDHAGTYQEWAEKAKANQMPEAALLLEEAIALTQKITEKFEAAERSIK